MMQAIASLLLVLILSPACAQERPVVQANSAGIPPARVGLEPPDLTSDIESSPIQLLLVATGRPILEEEISNFESLLSLEDSTGQDVAFTTQVEHEAPGTFGPGAHRAFLVIRPNLPLRAGWHSVILSRVPEGWTTFPETWAPRAVANDSVVARLFIGDAPTLRKVTICWSDEKLRPLLEFSQGVSTGENGHLPSVMADGNACSILTSEPQRGSTSLDFDCPGSEMPATLTVDVRGMNSPGGRPVALGGIDGTRVELAADQFDVDSSHGENCRAFRF